jgi:hypothetical protein
MPNRAESKQSYRGEMTSLSNSENQCLEGLLRLICLALGFCRCIPDGPVKAPGRPPKHNQSKGPSTVTSSPTSRVTVHFPILHGPGSASQYACKKEAPPRPGRKSSEMFIRVTKSGDVGKDNYQVPPWAVLSAPVSDCGSEREWAGVWEAAHN